MKKSLSVLVALGALAFIAFGCSTEPDTASGRDQLDNDCQQALARMKTQDDGLDQVLSQADAYAIFPTVGKAGAVVGGAYGHGEVFEGGNLIGYADLSQATIGAQLGGQSYSEIIVFQDKDALQRFQKGQLAFDANASAVALKSGAAASAKFKDGVAVMVSPIGGLMVEAAIGGQSFSYQPK